MEIRGTNRSGLAGLADTTDAVGKETIAVRTSESTTEDLVTNPPGQTGAHAFLSLDPLLRSVVQARLNQGSPAAVPAQNGKVLYTKDEVGGTGSPAPTRATAKMPAEVAAMLAEGAKVPEAKAEFTGAQQAIAAGDYAKAYGYLESLMRKQGEEVLSDDAVKATQTVRDQLEFLSKMKQAGIKADYPPTEAQLVDYFQTLKNNPAAARQAFRDYAEQFHVHPANAGAKRDIVYSKDSNEYGTQVPDSWSEVANRPSKDPSKHIGKQMNDCEGYAFMAGKLLTAAGFKVAHHITVHPAPDNSGHAMVSFTHPKEKGFTVTSNHLVFQQKTEKAAAIEGFKSVVTEATGKEHHYIGKTMVEAQRQSVIKDNEL